MCESWMYGCGHVICTPCPRPKPATIRPSNASYNSSNGSNSNMSSSSHSSPHRRGSSMTSYSNSNFTDLILATPVSKLCNGSPLVPKETNLPCYNCILADARQQIQLERPEVEAKKAELHQHGGMARNIPRGPDAHYVDEFGNRIVAEEGYEQDLLGGGYGGGRRRGFTGGARGIGGYNGNNPGRTAVRGPPEFRSVYFGGGVDGAPVRRNSGATGAFAMNGRSDYATNGVSQHGRRNTVTGTGVFAGPGHGDFRGGNAVGVGVGNVANANTIGASGVPRWDNNNTDQIGNGNGNNGAGLANANGFGFRGPPTIYSFHGGAQLGRNAYNQQNSTYGQPDFGGASWGQSQTATGASGGGGGLLGHGLDGVNSLYTQQQQQQNGTNWTNNAGGF